MLRLQQKISSRSWQDVVAWAVRVELGEDRGEELVELRAARLEGGRKQLLLLPVRALHAVNPLLRMRRWAAARPMQTLGEPADREEESRRRAAPTEADQINRPMRFETSTRRARERTDAACGPKAWGAGLRGHEVRAALPTLGGARCPACIDMAGDHPKRLPSTCRAMRGAPTPVAHRESIEA